MATKKKELLEQENPAPETTVPVENTPPPSRKIPHLRPRFPWRTLRPLMKRRLIWRRPLMAAI